MKRLAATIWQLFGIWLLLLATALPDLHLHVSRLADERAKEEKEGKGEEERDDSHEQQRAKESLAHSARRHLWDVGGLHFSVVPQGTTGPSRRVAAWHGQVCLSDGLQGERGLCNGCGAVLLR
jgi:hypothetical protein